MVSARETVPVVVMGPPVNPVPVATLVTVPDPADPLDAAVIRPLCVYCNGSKSIGTSCDCSVCE